MATVNDPLALLKEELMNGNIALRLNCILRLFTTARALGEERTRNELIPFLSEDDDDELVLGAMVEELGYFIPYVGGVEHAHVLLPPLEMFCTEGETCVRDKAVESLCRIGSQMRDNDLINSFVPVVKRLAAGESFTARASACGLFHVAYPSAPDMLKTELRSIYRLLCQDDKEPVRKAAATNLGKFAATIESAYIKTDVVPMLEDFIHDDEYSLRLLAVEVCAALCKLLEPHGCVADILPLFDNFSQVTCCKPKYAVDSYIGAVSKGERRRRDNTSVQNEFFIVKVTADFNGDGESFDKLAQSEAICNICSLVLQEDISLLKGKCKCNSYLVHKKCQIKSPQNKVQCDACSENINYIPVYLSRLGGGEHQHQLPASSESVEKMVFEAILSQKWLKQCIAVPNI
ncbi:hypothetical protein CASFOL_003860 [Castilleja foliolosa]|uniref:Uncharacterized protein n=1 Tax=Castilleja foliolosa TaxID=1961234 RepID=A0ABD3EIV6_9LAMI